MTFPGFPIEGVHFYQDLEDENTREFWEEHKAVYLDAVRRPMEALVGELTDFGPAHLFRPYRDVRFAKDKTPYKTHQGAVVGVFERAGWYVALGPDGLSAGGGCYAMAPDQLVRFRRAVDAGPPGRELTRLLDGLVADGFQLAGESLRTAPRGFTRDHPQIGLLRRKAVSARRDFGIPPWLQSSETVAQVRAAWTAVTPLVEWFEKHVGPPEESRRR